MASVIANPSRPALRGLLNTLQAIPISQLVEDERTCGICREPYDQEPTLDAEDLSSAHETPFASASCYSLAELSLSSVDDSVPPEEIVVKTEIWVENQILIESYTLYHRLCDQDSELVGIDLDEHISQGDQPVRLPCGHVFGRKCLHIWLWKRPMSVHQNTCPLCRSQIIKLEPQWQRAPQMFAQHFRVGQEEEGESRIRDLTRRARAALTLRRIRRKSEHSGRGESGQQRGVLSLNVR